MQKLFGVILCSSLFILGANFAIAQSRPFSVSCPFEGQVLAFKNTTQPIPEPEKYPNTRPTEEFELTLKIKSHTFVPLCDGCSRSDGIKDMCYFLEGATIAGTWYTPGQPYTTGVNFQPSVDKTKVLAENSLIKGEMDSYDHIITNVALISVGSSDKSIDKNQVEQNENNVVSGKEVNNLPPEQKDAASSSKEVVIGFVVILILVIGGIVYFLSRQRKT